MAARTKVLSGTAPEPRRTPGGAQRPESCTDGRSRLRALSQSEPGCFEPSCFRKLAHLRFDLEGGSELDCFRELPSDITIGRFRRTPETDRHQARAPNAPGIHRGFRPARARRSEAA